MPIVSNRNIVKAISTRGGGGVPAILSDGNTVAWYDYTEGITEETGVSVWADKSVDALGDPNGNNLLQADTARQPTLTVNGVLFDGNLDTTDFLKTAPFVLNQPEHIYILFRLISWNGSRRVFDGNGNNSGMIISGDATPALKSYAGAYIDEPELDNLPVNTFGVARVLFDGVNSIFKLDDVSTAAGNMGLGNMGGFTLGATANGSAGHNVEVKEVIIRKVADNATDEAAIYDYLKKKLT